MIGKDGIDPAGGAQGASRSPAQPRADGKDERSFEAALSDVREHAQANGGIRHRGRAVSTEQDRDALCGNEDKRDAAAGLPDGGQNVSLPAAPGFAEMDHRALPVAVADDDGRPPLAGEAAHFARAGAKPVPADLAQIGGVSRDPVSDGRSVAFTITVLGQETHFRPVAAVSPVREAGPEIRGIGHHVARSGKAEAVEHEHQHIKCSLDAVSETQDGEGGRSAFRPGKVAVEILDAGSGIHPDRDGRDAVDPSSFGRTAVSAADDSVPANPRLFAASPMRQLRLQLAPAALGPVSVALSSQARALRVALTAERGQVVKDIEQGKQDLAGRLVGLGYVLDGISVGQSMLPAGALPANAPEPGSPARGGTFGHDSDRANDQQQGRQRSRHDQPDEQRDPRSPGGIFRTV